MTEPAPEQCLCTALRQASRRVSQHYDMALGPTGLSANQFSILSRLEGGPATIQALARELVMDRSTLGHLLRPLDHRGVIALAAPVSDRRCRHVRLTPAGTALIEQARPLWRMAQTCFETAYGVEAARALRADLRQICSTEPVDARHP